jgi:hypothetical protein
MLVCDTLECIEKRMVGTNGYETALLPRIASCSESTKLMLVGFNLFSGLNIGFTWYDTSTV